MRERSRSERMTLRRPRRINQIRVRHHYAGFTSLANVKREAFGSSNIVRKPNESYVMAVGLTGPGPDPQNQKNVIRRQFMERGSCTFCDRCKFFHDPSIPAGNPNSNSRTPTPKGIPKGIPHGTPRGTPRGEVPKKASKDKRPKSPKLSAVAEVVEINAEPSEESNSTSEEEESDSESDGSLSTSKEQGSSSSGE